MAIGWDLDAERDLWRAICAPNSWHADDGETSSTHPQSLWWFVNVGWGAKFFLEKHPEEPQWLYEPIHGKYLTWLQKHLLNWKAISKTGVPGRYHIATVLPRGYGKTVSATKAASLWTHLDEPDMSTLICSSTSGLSADIVNAIAAVISGADDDAWFSWLYGNWRQGSSTWKPKETIVHGARASGNRSEASFDVSATDIGMTGYHHRQHWWDDPIIKNKLKEGRTAYIRGVHDAVNASYNALQVNGLMSFVLTRYLDDDVAGRHFREEGVATWSGMDCPHLTLFDKVPFGEGVWHVFFFQTEDELDGAPTHPHLWNRQMIAEAKRRDPEDFSCQQQNNPGTGERAPLLESQVPSLYTTYADFAFSSNVEWATIHIDTAFKRLETVRTGDDSAIVVWLKDSRDNGMMYLDTDLLRHSNEWREEDFNLELVRVCLALRRRGIFIRAITDEIEPGGKAGTYKNRLLGVLRGSGINLGEQQFIQLNRSTSKKARIRTAAGHWAEGYVRILLNKSEKEWIIPSSLRKLIGQILRIDVVQHDDLADAATDGFIPQLWKPPMTNPGIPQDEGATIRRPWDDDLKNIGKPPTDEEVAAWDLERGEMEESGFYTPIHDWDEEYFQREPV